MQGKFWVGREAAKSEVYCTYRADGYHPVNGKGLSVRFRYPNHTMAFGDMLPESGAMATQLDVQHYSRLVILAEQIHKQTIVIAISSCQTYIGPAMQEDYSFPQRNYLTSA